MKNMDISNNVFKKIFVVVHLFAAIIIAYACLVLTEVSSPFIESFAVDSEGKVYIASENSIAIHSGQTEIGRIDINAKRPWRFTINEKDEIICCTSSTVWKVDLSGNELEKYQDHSAQLYSKLQFSSRDEDMYGNTYRRVSYLGRTRIIKNETEVVYQISLLSLFTKILLYFGLIGFPVGVIIIVKGVLEELSKNRKSVYNA